MQRVRLGIILAVITIWIAGQAVGIGAVLDFAPAGFAEESNAYSVQVNGEPVFVERFTDVHYAHFGIAGHAEIEVTAPGRVREFTISPRSYGIQGTLKDGKLRFTLDRPRKLVITVNSGEMLFLFADRLEPEAFRPGDPAVVNVMDYVTDNTGRTLQTQNIQRAIDDLSARPMGGVLYFPPGAYLTGSIAIRDNVTVYLAPGALILGSTNPADYTTFADESCLIYFDNAKNAALVGHGVVDGNGTFLRTLGFRSFLVRVDQSRDVLIEGVVLKDPATWNTHIFYSEDVTLRNVKIINNMYAGTSDPNTDGIDPDASVRVLIEDVFNYAGDDNVAIKATNRRGLTRDVEDIVVRDSVFISGKSSLKVGTETRTEHLHNIVFQNIDIVRTDRAVSLYLYDMGQIHDVAFKDIRVEKVAGSTEQRLIDIRVRDRGENPPRRLSESSRIYDIYFQDFIVDEWAPNPSRLQSFDAARSVSNIHFENFRIAGRTITSIAAGRFMYDQHIDRATITFSDYPAFVELPLRYGEVITGPLALDLWVEGLPRGSQIDRVVIHLDGAVLYDGASLPTDLVLNNGELEDGQHTLEVVIEAGRKVVAKRSIAFEVQNSRVTAPSRGQRVYGDVPVAVETALPEEKIAHVTLTVDGDAYPGAFTDLQSIRLDTRQLDDGLHTLAVRIETVDGTTSTAEIDVHVENWTVAVDGLAPGTVLDEPTTILVQARANPDNVAVGRMLASVNGTQVYEGTESDVHLALNQGELSDGSHELSVVVESETGGRSLPHVFPFRVSNTKVTSPPEGKPVSGEVAVHIDTSLSPDVIAQVDVYFGDEQVSTGTSLPHDLTIDTRGLSNGSVPLRVEIRTNQGAVSTAQIDVEVQNTWQLVDDMRQPFFGMDWSQTLRASSGWGYADSPRSLFRDTGRRVRVANTTEELVWSAPNLERVQVSLYVRDTAVDGVVQLAYSPDDTSWFELPFAVRIVDEESDWYHLSLEAEVPAGQEAAVFRLTLRESSLPPETVQIGSVTLTGSL